MTESDTFSTGINSLETTSTIFSVISFMLIIFGLIKVFNALSHGEDYFKAFTFILAGFFIAIAPNTISSVTNNSFEKKTNIEIKSVANSNESSNNSKFFANSNETTKPEVIIKKKYNENKSVDFFPVLKYFLYTFGLVSLLIIVIFIFIITYSFIYYKIINKKTANLIKNTNSFEEIVKNILIIEEHILKTSIMIKNDCFFKNKIIELNKKLKNKKTDLDLILNEQEELLMVKSC